ncbi:glutathione S-transferase 2-like isoform X2 [Chrysemys picta bellii]|uniref:glutathione S-transferase 2-like isoform X2 n=1 Tax=Chrysemys picta bellii TaxID=8478 RepID=UPI0032B2A11E
MHRRNCLRSLTMAQMPSCMSGMAQLRNGSGNTGPDYDISQWTNEKEKLGLDFPNLSYLIDGQTKLTQSNAILRYVAHKHKMAGESEEEMQRVDMLENQVMDFRLAFARICYNPDFLTYVDFLVYDILDQHRTFAPKCLDQLKNLKDFLDRFEALEKLTAYMSSSRYMKTPIFWRTAQWSNKKE